MKKNTKCALVLLMGLCLAFSLLTPTALAAEPQAGYRAWESSESLPSSGLTGKYYLTKDVTLTAADMLGEGTDLTIDLMGHNITQTTAGKRIFRLSNGAKLTIEDSTATGEGENYKAGVMYAAGGQTDPGFIVGLYDYPANSGAGKTSTFTMKGGIMDGSAVTETIGSMWGGAINLGAATAKVVIDGGLFRNFRCCYGAVIGGRTFKSITVNGGEFCNNTSAHPDPSNVNQGGGVIAVNANDSDTTITINGGKFYNNTANTASAILINGKTTELIVNGGEFFGNRCNITSGSTGGVIRTVQKTGYATTINGGYFHDNSASGNGGALWVTSPLTMTGGVFVNNTADGNGGAIYVTIAAADISGVTVIGNKAGADQNGGGIFGASAATFKLSGALTVTGNTANGAPNDMYFQKTNDVSGLTAGAYVKYVLGDEAEFIGGTAEMTSYLLPDDESKSTVFTDGKLAPGAKDASLIFVTSGAGSFLAPDSDASLTFAANGPAVKGVKVDGKELAAADFTASGSSAVLTNAFLKTLADGAHTLELLVDGGSCAPVQFTTGPIGASTVTVPEEPDEPDEPDEPAEKDYTITDGDGGTYELNTYATLTFTTDAFISNLTGVKVDGKEIDPTLYTLRVHGITLKTLYLDTLAPGQHSLELLFNSGKCPAVSFTTTGTPAETEAPETPEATEAAPSSDAAGSSEADNTEDVSGPSAGLFIGIAAAVIVLALGAVILTKKKTDA